MPRPNRGYHIHPKPNTAGFWLIAWADGGRSHRLSTGTRSRQEADAVLAGFILERQRVAGEPAQPAASTSIAVLLDAYERERIEAKAVDVERALMAGKPVRAFFGMMQPQDIDATATNAYAAKRRAGGRVRSDATIRRELQHLRAAILWGVKQRRIPQDVVPHIDMPDRVEPRSRVLSEDEIRRVLSVRIEDQPTRRDRAGGQEDPRLSRIHRFLSLMLMAPARPEAVLHLTWFQVDFDRRLIDYRMPGRQRTKKRRTVVPISDRLLPILRRAHAEKRNEFVLDEPGEIRKTFATAMRDAGLDDVTPYVLRHTWATRSVAAGVPIAKVAQILGDTVETVARNYVHLTPEHLRDAVEGAWGVAHNAPIADER